MCAASPASPPPKSARSGTLARLRAPVGISWSTCNERRQPFFSCSDFSLCCICPLRITASSERFPCKRARPGRSPPRRARSSTASSGCFAHQSFERFLSETITRSSSSAACCCADHTSSGTTCARPALFFINAIIVRRCVGSPTSSHFVVCEKGTLEGTLFHTHTLSISLSPPYSPLLPTDTDTDTVGTR